MFGYFKLDSKCPPNIMSAYKKYYCLLCRGLQFHYGIKSRLLLSYDVTFLMIFLDENDSFHNVKKIKCLNTSPDLTDACSSDFVKTMAAINILFAAGKLEDDKIDEKDFKAIIGQAFFSNAIKKAKKDFPNIWTIIKKEYENIRKKEQNHESCESIEDAFAVMLCRIAVEHFRIKEDDKLNLIKLAAKWLYFVDAIDDLDKNLQGNVFNPLSHMISSYNLKNKEYLKIGAHFRSLYKNRPFMNGNINASIINRVLYFGMPEMMLRVVEGKNKTK